MKLIPIHNGLWILKKRLEISQIKIIFPKEDVYQYKIEAADGYDNWSLVADFMNNQNMESEKKIEVPQLVGNLIRISFKDAKKAKIAEMEVIGIVLE